MTMNNRLHSFHIWALDEGDGSAISNAILFLWKAIEGWLGPRACVESKNEKTPFNTRRPASHLVNRAVTDQEENIKILKINGDVICQVM
jgi:hypothetical protein